MYKWYLQNRRVFTYKLRWLLFQRLQDHIGDLCIRNWSIKAIGLRGCFSGEKIRKKRKVEICRPSKAREKMIYATESRFY